MDLKAAGYAVNLREFKDAGHALPSDHQKEFSAALQWVLSD
jgi:hypothetical protein